jgi:hypothetical protein
VLCAVYNLLASIIHRLDCGGDATQALLHTPVVGGRRRSALVCVVLCCVVLCCVVLWCVVLCCVVLCCVALCCVVLCCVVLCCVVVSCCVCVRHLFALSTDARYPLIAVTAAKLFTERNPPKNDAIALCS